MKFAVIIFGIIIYIPVLCLLKTNNMSYVKNYIWRCINI